MRKFQNLSIKKRLLFIIMSVNILSLILAFLGFMAYDYFLFRKSAVQELTVTADVIGYNCAAALIFKDDDDAERTLESLRADRSIMEAWIFAKDKGILARYVRENTAQT